MLPTCDAASTAHSLLSSVFAAHHLTIKLCDHQNLWYSLSHNRDTSLSISNPPSRFTTVHSLAKDCVLTKQHKTPQSSTLSGQGMLQTPSPEPAQCLVGPGNSPFARLLAISGVCPLPPSTLLVTFLPCPHKYPVKHNMRQQLQDVWLSEIQPGHKTSPSLLPSTQGALSEHPAPAQARVEFFLAAVHMPCLASGAREAEGRLGPLLCEHARLGKISLLLGKSFPKEASVVRLPCPANGNVSETHRVIHQHLCHHGEVPLSVYVLRGKVGDRSRTGYASHLSPHHGEGNLLHQIHQLFPAYPSPGQQDMLNGPCIPER